MKTAILVCLAISAISLCTTLQGRMTYWQGYSDGMACAAQIHRSEPLTRCPALK